MILCHYIGIPAYHGAIVSTLITELGPALYLLLYLKKAHNLKFKELIINTSKTIICNLIMLASLYLVSLIYPIKALTRKGAIIEIGIYMIVGIVVYIIASYLLGLIKEILGNRIKKIGL